MYTSTVPSLLNPRPISPQAHSERFISCAVSPSCSYYHFKSPYLTSFLVFLAVLERMMLISPEILTYSTTYDYLLLSCESLPFSLRGGQPLRPLSFPWQPFFQLPFFWAPEHVLISVYALKWTVTLSLSSSSFSPSIIYGWWRARHCAKNFMCYLFNPHKNTFSSVFLSLETNFKTQLLGWVSLILLFS